MAGQRVESFLAVYVFDLQGTMLRTARVGQELGFIPGGKALGITRLVAVAPDDYIMLYSRLDNGELWVARFQLVPL